jgi:hypothetical protein
MGNNGKKGSIGEVLMLLAMLEGLSGGGLRVGGRRPDNVHDVILGGLDYEPMDDDVKDNLEKSLEALSKIDRSNIKSYAILVVHKRPEGEVCPDCNEIHEGGGIALLQSTGGDPWGTYHALQTAARRLEQEAAMGGHDLYAPAHLNEDGREYVEKNRPASAARPQPRDGLDALFTAYEQDMQNRSGR